MALCMSSFRFASRSAATPLAAVVQRRTIAVAAPRRGLVVSAAAAAAPATVKIIIQGRRLPVTEAIKEYVEQKVTKACSHFSGGLKHVDVTLSARGGDTGTHGKKAQKAEVTIHTLRHGVVRVEDSEESLYAAIDLVSDKVERKLRRSKERAIAKGRWHNKGAHADEDKYAEFKEEVSVEINEFDREQALQKQFAELNAAYPEAVRRAKTVALDLMTTDEAIDAMESVGHDFFLFRDMETDGAIRVLYRRQSEGYGILQPVNRE